jgi:predicted RND superfamily exporter protein
MAKVTIEMNVDDDTVEEAVGSLKTLAGLEQANKDMSESLQLLVKAINKNNAEIRKLAKELAKKEEERQRLYYSRVKSGTKYNLM